jgi:hypothetical protein
MPSFGMSDSLAGYPHWLVVACTVFLAVVALWIVLKLIKAALWILFYGIIVVTVLSLVWYFLG